MNTDSATRQGERKAHVSVEEKERAKMNFDHKVKELEQIVQQKKWSEYPGRGHLTDFCTWEDAAKGIGKVSRSVLYDTLKNEREKANTLLRQLRAGRLVRAEEADPRTELKRRVNVAEKMAQSYVNQYAAISMEVNDLRAEVTRLNQENARLAAKLAKVAPLRRVGAKDEAEA